MTVLGNSNARGLAQGLCERGLDSTAFVYPGQTASHIQARLNAVLDASPSPDAIVVHAGDIEVRDYSTSSREVATVIQALLKDLSTKLPNIRIVLSGLPTACGNKLLCEKIREVLDLKNLANAIYCQEAKNCTFLCNEKARLCRDNIHLTVPSKDFISRFVAREVKQCL